MTNNYRTETELLPQFTVQQAMRMEVSDIIRGTEAGRLWVGPVEIHIISFDMEQKGENWWQLLLQWAEDDIAFLYLWIADFPCMRTSRICEWALSILYTWSEPVFFSFGYCICNPGQILSHIIDTYTVTLFLKIGEPASAQSSLIPNRLTFPMRHVNKTAGPEKQVPGGWWILWYLVTA